MSLYRKAYSRHRDCWKIYGNTADDGETPELDDLIATAQTESLADAIIQILESGHPPACSKRGIYTASRVRHANKWLKLRGEGVPIVATWIDEAGVGQTDNYPDLWRRCIEEAASAEAVLVYAEEGDSLKGALVEVGAALGSGTPVFCVGPMEGSWVQHPLVARCESLESALGLIQMYRKNQ